MRNALSMVVAALGFMTVTSVAEAKDRLLAGESLKAGELLASKSNIWKLACQLDGNFVLYKAGSSVWQSGTWGKVLLGCYMQTDGNLVLYTKTGAVWASSTSGNPGAFLMVQDDGNIVIYSVKGMPLWTKDSKGTYLL